MSPQTLTLIGGAGFLGRSLVRRLAETPGWQDAEIRCVDRAEFPPDSARPPRFQQYVGDARRRDVLTEALAGADAVWVRAAMLGGPASIDAARIPEYLDLNVNLVAQVLDACAQTGCSKVLFDSSEQVFGDPADQQAQTPEAEPVAGNYYGAGKLIAEKLLRLWSAGDGGRSVQIMRYSRVRAGDTRDVIRVMLADAVAGKPLRVLGNSTRRVAFVHLEDVLAANLAALDRRPNHAVYHVGADRPLSLLELAIRIRDVAYAATGAWSRIDIGPGAPPFEPHVVGMRWESSRRQLGLPVPRSLDDMLYETLAQLERPASANV